MRGAILPFPQYAFMASCQLKITGATLPYLTLPYLTLPYLTLPFGYIRFMLVIKILGSNKRLEKTTERRAS
jgi:hypothetical protein